MGELCVKHDPHLRLVALQHSNFATRNFPEQIRVRILNCLGGDLCGCHRLGLFWVTYDTVASAKESERAMSFFKFREKTMFVFPPPPV